MIECLRAFDLSSQSYKCCTLYCLAKKFPDEIHTKLVEKLKEILMKSNQVAENRQLFAYQNRKLLTETLYQKVIKHMVHITCKYTLNSNQLGCSQLSYDKVQALYFSEWVPTQIDQAFRVQSNRSSSPFSWDSTPRAVV